MRMLSRERGSGIRATIRAGVVIRGFRRFRRYFSMGSTKGSGSARRSGFGDGGGRRVVAGLVLCAPGEMRRWLILPIFVLWNSSSSLRLVRRLAELGLFIGVHRAALGGGRARARTRLRFGLWHYFWLVLIGAQLHGISMYRLRSRFGINLIRGESSRSSRGRPFRRILVIGILVVLGANSSLGST